MNDFADKKIVLGISGGIAAYKAAYLLRELVQLGAKVRVVMTEDACQFITPLTFQALSGYEVRTTLWDAQAERGMSHIELARWADYFVIAPATANTLAKLAQGIADDLLSTLHLVVECPVIICPAMNRSMWAHPATQSNIALLKKRAVLVIGPDEGEQACGEIGCGRMANHSAIINGLRLYKVRQLLDRHQVLISAGPTREAIDPVRYLTNYSSGKMGYALAEAAVIAGASVTLISGPSALPLPLGVQSVLINTGQEMYEAVRSSLKPNMIFIAAAAVSDFCVATQAKEKIKKSYLLQLQLQQNPDILKMVGVGQQALFTVGFAAETSNLLEHARAKLEDKNLDMIIANLVGPDLGFEKEVNEVTVITRDRIVPLALEHKVHLAAHLIELIAYDVQKKLQN